MNVVIDEIKVSNPWAARPFQFFTTTVYTAYSHIAVKSRTKAGAKRKAFKIAGRLASNGDTITLCSGDEDPIGLLFPSLESVTV